MCNFLPVTHKSDWNLGYKKKFPNYSLKHKNKKTEIEERITRTVMVLQKGGTSYLIWSEITH